MRNYSLLIFLLGFLSCIESEMSSRFSRIEQSMSLALDMDSVFCTLSALECDTGLMSPKELAHYAILKAEFVYRTTQKIDNHLLQSAGAYYLSHSSTSITRDRLLYRLLSSISEYTREEYLSAFDGLLGVHGSVESLSDPYLSGVVHYYLGRIYLHHRLYNRALSHFRREREYALQIGDINKLVKSDHHCALSFLTLGAVDSCWFYLSQSLQCLSRLDTLRRQMVLDNAIFLQTEFFPDRDLPLYGYCSAAGDFFDTLSVGNSIQTKFYSSYLERRISHLSGHESGRMLHSLFNYRRCKQNGDTNSALYYYEDYNFFKSKYFAGLRTADILEIENSYERNLRERSLLQYRGRFLFCSLLFLLLFFLFLFLFCYRYRRELQLLTAIEELRNAISYRESMLEEMRTRIDIFEQERHVRSGRLMAYRDLLSRLVLRFMLKKESAPLYGRDFALLVEDYAAGSSSSGRFVHLLRSLHIQLSDRDLFICILLREHGSSGVDLTSAIGAANRNAFKSAKSKIKSRLLSLKSQDRDIIHLLEQFG